MRTPISTVAKETTLSPYYTTAPSVIAIFRALRLHGSSALDSRSPVLKLAVRVPAPNQAGHSRSKEGVGTLDGTRVDA